MPKEVWIVQYATPALPLHSVWDSKQSVENWMQTHGMRKRASHWPDAFDILARDEDEVIYTAQSRRLWSLH